MRSADRRDGALGSSAGRLEFSQRDGCRERRTRVLLFELGGTGQLRASGARATRTARRLGAAVSSQFMPP